MIAMKLSWAALLVISLWATVYFGSPGGLALAGVLAALPLVSLPGNHFLRKRLQIRVETVPSVRKGDDSAVRVIIHNPTAVPLLLLRCRVTVENQLNRQKSIRILQCQAFPRKTRVYPLKLRSEYCGRLRISVEAASVYDCFGIFGLSWSGESVTHSVIQPDTFAMDVALLSHPGRSEESDAYSQERPGQDLTETYQLREYLPGDSPRQIHWKLSGKFDRLIVRDPALPIVRNVLVFWERTGDSGDPERIDAQAEVVVSLCRSLADGGIPFTLGWNDTDRDLCLIHEIPDMDTLVGIIPRLLRATGKTDGITGAALLTRTGMEVPWEHMAYIGEGCGEAMGEMAQYGQVTYLLCGEGSGENAISFSAENYRRQLAQLEL